MQTPILKECPQCGHFAPVAAIRCPACGHTYRTQFVAPLNQTQMVTPPSIPTPSPVAGPRDNTERIVSIWWHSVGLFFSGLILCGLILNIINSAQAENTEPIGYIAILLIADAAIASFFVMRIRRIYLYHSGPQQQWWAAVVLVVCLLDVLTLSLPSIFAKKIPADTRPGITFSGPTPIPSAPLQPLPAQAPTEAHPGMTKEQVRSLLGLPDSTQAYPNGECWIYAIANGKQTVCFSGSTVQETHIETRTFTNTL